MKKFILTGKVTISVYTKVEAETLEEAIEIASGRNIEAYSIWQNNSLESWVSHEYDGEVFDIEQEIE